MIDINCDMGEGIGNEEELVPYIDSANIACGYHAGDIDTIRQTIKLCQQYRVNVGAHPSFPDKENFGRVAMALPANELYQVIVDQLKMMVEISGELGQRLHHVKPHGALYNMAASDADLARTIAQAVKDVEPGLVYFGLSGSVMIAEAAKIGLATCHEAFADRSYQPDGKLTPRTQPGALLPDEAAVARQVSNLLAGKVEAAGGVILPIAVDTICIHGDGTQAGSFAKVVHQIVHAG